MRSSGARPKEHKLKAPQYAVISIALDTERYRQNVRPEVREGQTAYLLDRLLTGESVAESELEHLGWKVTIREALAPEILPGSNQDR